MERRKLLRSVCECWLIGQLFFTSGCSLWSPSAGAAPTLPNPLEIDVGDHQLVWNVIVDTIDDYFLIAHEQPVRWIGETVSEGRIVTHPQAGPTILESMRRDVTPGFERWHNTFQSLRRQAEVNVTPSRNGYRIQLTVRKELEDVDRPELATVGGAVQRHDGSLVRPQGTVVGAAVQLGWIPQGRDVLLEQKILADLHGRLFRVEAPPPIQTFH